MGIQRVILLDVAFVAEVIGCSRDEKGFPEQSIGSPSPEVVNDGVKTTVVTTRRLEGPWLHVIRAVGWRRVGLFDGRGFSCV